MEKLTWVVRPTNIKTAIHRPDAVTWTPRTNEPVHTIIENQVAHIKRGIEDKLWETRGEGQTLQGFIAEIKTQEGLTEPK